MDRQTDTQTAMATIHFASATPCNERQPYAYGEVTSYIYGRSTIAILWGNTVVLCVAKWVKICRVIRMKLNELI